MITSFEQSKTEVYDTYWKFACERQNIFIRRLNGETIFLTSDPILKEYKFTNVYRASDRVSQYLIKNVIYQDGYSEEDLVFRILLFKIFNKIETWELLEKRFGKINYAEFDVLRYGDFMQEFYEKGERLYSGAYIMPSGKTTFGSERKFRNHLMLLDYMMRDGVVKKILNCKGLKELYRIFLTYPTLGSFLAYQYAIDVNYSPLVNFSEMEFVVPGPGAKSGIRKCFGNFRPCSEENIIRYMCDHQEEEFARLGLNFCALPGRRLQLIDCQNIFCEVDKYARIKHPEILGRSGRTRIKQKYHQKGEMIDYFYPPKWHVELRK